MSDLESIYGEANSCDYAYQPIVSTSTLLTHGVEALARLPEARDGAAILDLLDRAEQAGSVLDVEAILIGKAISKFAKSSLSSSMSLFCNVDNRIFAGRVPEFSTFERTVRDAGLSFDRVVWEISERTPIVLDGAVSEFVSKVARSEVRIALDDFGIGISNLERLLVVEPHYVKIDRCFVDGLARNHRKQAIVAKLCGMAHALGYNTIAEGVETEDDFRAAREAGCDFAQGFLIARPTLAADSVRPCYDGVIQRTTHSPRISPRVADLLVDVRPVSADALLGDAAERFNADQNLVLLPVVDRHGLFKGAVYERDIRQLLLSDFGRDLLLNRGAAPRVESRSKRCPVADVHASVDAIINAYVTADAASGLVLLDGGRYAGYLSNNAVLRLAAERDISEARDQNPLTRLPGNHAIEAYIAGKLIGSDPVTITVIDFDNFKAFNDRYGFAAGDRALQMFGDALRKLEHRDDTFIGHIGGDDFFIGMSCADDVARERIVELCGKFAGDAASLYSPAEREAQGIRGHDRFGTARFFPLLRASAGVLSLPSNRAVVSREMIEDRLTALKASAKTTGEGVACGSIFEPSAPQGRLRDPGVRLVG